MKVEVGAGAPRTPSWSRGGRDARGQIAIVPAPPADADRLSPAFRVFAEPLETGPGETFVRTEACLRDQRRQGRRGR